MITPEQHIIATERNPKVKKPKAYPNRKFTGIIGKLKPNFPAANAALNTNFTIITGAAINDEIIPIRIKISTISYNTPETSNPMAAIPPNKDNKAVKQQTL